LDTTILSHDPFQRFPEPGDVDSAELITDGRTFDLSFYPPRIPQYFEMLGNRSLGQREGFNDFARDAAGMCDKKLDDFETHRAAYSLEHGDEAFLFLAFYGEVATGFIFHRENNIVFIRYS
jgi:hypothetical protein